MNLTQKKLNTIQREHILQDMSVLLDGRWFLKVAERFGFDEATHINLAVCKSIAKTEMKRILQEASYEKIENIEDFEAIMYLLSDLYWPEIQNYEFKIIDENTFCVNFYECHIHKMTSEAGTKDIHKCAGKYKGMGWLEACGLEGEIITDKNTNNCNGSCETIFKFNWHS